MVHSMKSFEMWASVRELGSIAEFRPRSLKVRLPSPPSTAEIRDAFQRAGFEVRYTIGVGPAARF
jgi:hypothetical protein